MKQSQVKVTRTQEIILGLTEKILFTALFQGDTRTLNKIFNQALIKGVITFYVLSKEEFIELL